ncbi:hypothetical protein [Clostridium sp. JN-1]|uniref:hypothetical protein n=1 Tax=Clostridium sp. JN-1 TaxID=2483110 RepID=UPI000F0B03C8|nr:hypothetical protein [Clostridium sp. JN-1]
MEKSEQDYKIELNGLQQEIENINNDKNVMILKTNGLKKEYNTANLKNKKLEYYYTKIEYLKLKLKNIKYDKAKLDMINLIKKEWQKILNILEENIKIAAEEKNFKTTIKKPNGTFDYKYIADSKAVDEADLIYRKEKQKYIKWIKELE